MNARARAREVVFLLPNQINKGALHIHHDALEFPGGEIVLLTRLCEGQKATVLSFRRSPRLLPRWKPNRASPTSTDVRPV
jgi:hypothetical protein